MRSRLTCLLLLACLPAVSVAHEGEILDASENALIIEEVKLQVGDPSNTPRATSEAGTETFGVSDSTSLIEDVQLQVGDPPAATPPELRNEDAIETANLIKDISLQSGDPLSTQDMMASSQEELASLRERIHTAYQINAESLSGDSKVALGTSQKAWETYVASTCQVESEREAGSITPVINLSCQVREAQRRLDWLNDTL